MIHHTDTLMASWQKKYNQGFKEQQQFFDDLLHRIRLRLKKLDEDILWKENPEVRPAFVSPENMLGFQEMIEKATSFLNAQQLSLAWGEFERLNTINSERSKVFVARTRIGHDVYSLHNVYQLKTAIKRFLNRQSNLQIINVFAISILQNDWVETKQWVSVNGTSSYKQIGLLDAQAACLTRDGYKLANIKVFRETMPNSKRNKYQFTIVCIDEALEENLIN